MCHQTVGLVSRYLEANGIPTVVIGAARDIIETCGVARFVFTDFPLGSPCGEPGDVDMQRHIVGLALDLLETATEPRTTIQSPYAWSDGEDWKQTVFTLEQPWQTEEETRQWLEKKELHRKMRAEGRV